MPQISDLEKFARCLRNCGISFKMTEIHPLHLAASQGNFIMKKVDELRKFDSHDPIIIANDLHILDGHHRWLAQSDRDSVDVLRVELPISDLITKAHEFNEPSSDE